MPEIDVRVDCPVYDSFRVQQVAGLFDVPIGERASASFAVDVPGVDEEWQIGLIVGPSGSGKTTIARAAFGQSVYAMPPWPSEQAVIDGFGELPIRSIVGLLTAVGLSSPPAWIKPYAVLSGGEQFRCDLARALATALAGRSTESERPLVVFDEFTSVVDRQVAQVGSAAVAKAVRGDLATVRFVAVGCHYDVAEWLEPDWVIDMATRKLARRRLRRPSIELEVFRSGRNLWPLFAPHHYLSGELSVAARCYVALWQGRPVTFCALLPVIGQRGYWRFSRIVTLPDYQGIGLGMRVVESIADLYRQERLRIGITASHPAVVAHCRRSTHWRTAALRKTGSRHTERFIANYRGSAGRAVVSFEYIGRATAEQPETAP
jgi:GNAT superfamily N-acetyltransferase